MLSKLEISIVLIELDSSCSICNKWMPSERCKQIDLVNLCGIKEKAIQENLLLFEKVKLDKLR